MAEKSLSGKAALVTGGSRGIGAAIALRLAREGADVALTYVSSPTKAEAVVAQIEKLERRAVAIPADGGDPEAVKVAVQQAADALGRLDILVNNAGVILMGTVDQFTLDDFDRIVAVNVRAVFAATQEAVRHIPDGGRIINIGSIVADRSFIAGGAFYSMSKAALAAMSRGFAIDLAPRSITVNNIQPGPTATDMNPADGPHADFTRNIVPLKRFGEADEIASFVSYLAGPDAAFITGASLTIDGGTTA